MKAMGRAISLVAMMALVGCGSLMHPKAGDFLKQAQGPAGQEASGIATLINLTTMMETSAKAARAGQNYEEGLDDLHNQFYALGKAFCLVTEAQSSAPAYVKAVTIKREMKTVFRRLWKYRDDPALREVHADLFMKRAQELREALQAVRG
jgi:hypothetical protein